MITIADVEYVALLSRLELTEDEKIKYTEQLNAMLEYAGMLEELNTDNIQPTAHVLSLKNVFREDQATGHLSQEKALQNAPDADGSFFKVPKIV
ncbi:MAG: Asp-tRNA(Asn)/Glu-tRNA(Gln) amidotransferase subunit GatC [Peptococcaceae bacterium]|nr:Asp-tRNA(Asn)/Glu-tRNA(Gln) amidotransferase subunit GatC [Peptococcaceae bacterium]